MKMFLKPIFLTIVTFSWCCHGLGRHSGYGASEICEVNSRTKISEGYRIAGKDQCEQFCKMTKVLIAHIESFDNKMTGLYMVDVVQSGGGGRGHQGQCVLRSEELRAGRTKM